MCRFLQLIMIQVEYKYDDCIPMNAHVQPFTFPEVNDWTLLCYAIERRKRIFSRSISSMFAALNHCILFILFQRCAACLHRTIRLFSPSSVTDPHRVLCSSAARSILHHHRHHPRLTTKASSSQSNRSAAALLRLSKGIVWRPRYVSPIP